MHHLHLLEDFVDAFLTIGRGDTQIEKRELDVFIDRQFIDEIKALEDKANVRLAHARPLPFAEL